MKYIGIFLVSILLTFTFLTWFRRIDNINDKSIIVNNTDTVFVMNVTCYKITDSKIWNNKTAWMKPVNITDPFSSRVVALPREMIKNKCGQKKYNKNAYFSFGDSIEIIGKDFIYSGKYIVGEITRNTIHNSIDICVGKNNKISVWRGVFVKKIKKI